MVLISSFIGYFKSAKRFKFPMHPEKGRTGSTVSTSILYHDLFPVTSLHICLHFNKDTIGSKIAYFAKLLCAL